MEPGRPRRTIVTPRIAIIVEGATEKAFGHCLRQFLAERVGPTQPKLTFIAKDGRIPKGSLLKRDVERLLRDYDHVIALTDVYTGTNPRDFENAEDAKAKMRQWVGKNPRFHPHAAQYEFEAWLLPYWTRVRRLSGTNRQVPSRTPETVNHNKPPSPFLQDAFHTGKRRSYRKTLDGTAILQGQDLAVAAAACPELKALLNAILALSDAPPL